MTLGTGGEDVNINAFSAVIIYLIVSAYELMNESFPHLIGISSSRGDYWIGKTCFFFVLAAAMSLMQGLILILEYLILPFNVMPEKLSYLIGNSNFFTVFLRFVFFNISSFFLAAAFFSLFYTIAYRMKKVFYILLICTVVLLVIFFPYIAEDVTSVEDSLSIIIETAVRTLVPIVDTDFAISTSLYYLLLSIPLSLVEYLVLSKTEVK